MANTHDFLVEIGTEELPPGAVLPLAKAFEQQLTSALNSAGLSFNHSQYFATPRRLAVLISGLIAEQAASVIERRGPAFQAAFDAAGEPTQACISFARSVGITPDQLIVLENDKGKWVVCNVTQPAIATIQLLPEIVQQALTKLPIARGMRWGDYGISFIRPVHWVVMLYGDEVIKTTILGKTTDRYTYGHRFLPKEIKLENPEKIELNNPSQYLSKLKNTLVEANFAERQQTIKNQIAKLELDLKNKGLEASVVIEDALLETVTALVEWPVALLVKFDDKFLQIPAEALIAAMRDHQKCFYVVDQQQKLLPYFVTVANIQIDNPINVIKGNERVMRARLEDAAFFFHYDCKQKLQNKIEVTKHVVYQAKLGSLFDKSQRLIKISQAIAKKLRVDAVAAERAAALAKCDLMTTMVGEFPELQGIMGYYYARHDSEDEAVAVALKEYYWPRFAQDQLPTTSLGCVLALAERLDNLVGIIGINQKPTGDKDPYQLRRAAIGIVRILIEQKLDLDLISLLQTAIDANENILPNKQVLTDVHDFIIERLRGWCLERGITSDVIAAVLAKQANHLFDFYQRVKAVTEFRQLPQAAALAAANKRVSKILQKENQSIISEQINSSLLQDKAEQELAELVIEKKRQIAPLYQAGKYTEALTQLASLREPIDHFFDKVMVMVEDENIRRNRLALLNELHQLFMQIADISLLQPQQDVAT